MTLHEAASLGIELERLTSNEFHLTPNSDDWAEGASTGPTTLWTV